MNFAKMEKAVFLIILFSARLLKSHKCYQGIAYTVDVDSKMLESKVPSHLKEKLLDYLPASRYLHNIVYLLYCWETASG